MKPGPDQSGPAPAAVVDYRRPAIARLRRVRSAREEACKIAGLATLFIYYGSRAPSDKFPDAFCFCGVLMWVGIVAVIVVRPFIATRDTTRDGSAAWLVPIAVSLITALFLLVMPLLHVRHSCCHGTRWANRQIGIAWSDNGGPCGNGVFAREGRAWPIAKNWYLYRPHK